MHNPFGSRDFIHGNRSARAQRVVHNICWLVHPMRGYEIEKLWRTGKGGPLTSIANLDARERFHPCEGRVKRRRQLKTLTAVWKHLRFQYPSCQHYQYARERKIPHRSRVAAPLYTCYLKGRLKSIS